MSSNENRIQVTLEEAVSNNRESRGGGLLAVSFFDRTLNRTCATSTFVTGRRADLKSSFIENDTPYGIASITKTFVATLTLMYAEKKLLDLDSPIVDLFEERNWILDPIRDREMKRNLKSVTIRQLLSHRTGFADYWDNDKFINIWRKNKGKHWSHLEILQWAGKRKPKCEVDGCFHYSDTNYIIMGLILEQYFGKKLHRLFKEAFFDPLNMRCSWMYFEEEKPTECKPIAHSYEKKLDVTKNQMQSADWSGGGIYSTLKDQIIFFNELFFTERLISENSRKEMFSWQKTNWGRNIKYGLGIYRIEIDRGMTLIGHKGIHNAFSFLWEESDILFTGSLNQERNESIDRLLHPVMQILQRDGIDHWLNQENMRSELR
jgi:CubicO group peptidase (beta-lactamase class C family)